MKKRLCLPMHRPLYAERCSTVVLLLARFCIAGLVLNLWGCDDKVASHFPCAGVLCGANAFCVPATGACVCNEGFESDGTQCVERGCDSDRDCNDGITCNGIETCDSASGQCQSTAAVSCGTNASCTEPFGDCACEPSHIDLGAGCEPIICTRDSDCDDGNVCNGIEQCRISSSECLPGTPIVCGDFGTCDANTGQCDCAPTYEDRGQGCEPITCATDADCQDGLACNGRERCDSSSSTCQPGFPVHCGTYEQCRDDQGAPHCVATRPKGASACMLIGGSDWGGTGMLAIYNLDTGVLKDNITSFAQDAAIRVLDDEVYVLERHMYDAVLKLDQRDNYKTVWNFSVAYEDASVPNPHDMVRWGDYLFIALYNEGIILRANLHPNPLNPSSFLGILPYAKRIQPAAWDGMKAELTKLRVEGDILFGLTQGLGDDWTCTTSENKGQMHAFHLPDLQEAYVFEGEKSSVTLAHCNPGGWIDMPDGQLLIHSLGGYRSIHGPADDGGLQLFDIANRRAGAVVATETSMDNNDIFDVARVGDRFFAILAGDNFGDTGVYELIKSAGGLWKTTGERILNGYMWAVFGHENTLYLAERSTYREAIRAINLETLTQEKVIETLYPPDTIGIFYRQGGCW